MNKLLSMASMTVTLVSILIADDGSIVAPKYDQVSVYQNMPRLLNEIPIFKVSTSDHLKVLDKNECCFMVIDTQGRTGWIEKSKCSRALNGTSLRFESAKVEGLNDINSPYVIFGKTDAEELEIKLSRSFRENLMDNVDREEICRITGKFVDSF